jgi:hypothetical protein
MKHSVGDWKRESTYLYQTVRNNGVLRLSHQSGEGATVSLEEAIAEAIISLARAIADNSLCQTDSSLCNSLCQTDSSLCNI